MKCEKGLTLIEVVVASLIFSLTIFLIINIYQNLYDVYKDQYYSFKATTLAKNKMERLLSEMEPVEGQNIVVDERYAQQDFKIKWHIIVNSLKEYQVEVLWKDTSKKMKNYLVETRR